MLTYQHLADSISGIRWRMRDEKRSAIVFDFCGQTLTINEPRDVIIDDNQASKNWIAVNYGFLLAILWKE
jgi:hypothetical protein